MWSLVFAHQPSSAEGTVPTNTSPALVAAPQEGFGVRPQSLRCLFSGVCPQASWQDGVALLGAASLPPGNR